MRGIPMIADSPIQQNSTSPLMMHGIDVIPYQPPWKALSDFAMHGHFDTDDIDQQHNQNVAFQRLVHQVHI